MKKIVTLLALVLCLTLAFTQEKVDLIIAGITPDIEKSLLPGDQISYFEFDNGSAGKNLKVVVETELGKKNFFGIVNVKPVNGHYDFKQAVSIKESSRVSFEGDIELLVSMPTIYGNSIWTKVTRNKSNLTDPIILDQYTEKPGRDYEARNRFELNFTCIAYDNEFKKSVKDKGDGWSKRKKEHFKFMLKNKGDAEWKIDEVMTLGSITNGSSASAKIENKGRLDLNKNIVMRVDVTTEQGNILWNEVEFEARGMNRTYFGVNYDIVEKSDPPQIDETTVVADTTTNDNTSTKPDLTNDVPVTTNDGKGDNNGDQGGKDENNTTAVNTTTVNTTTKPVSAGATDLTTQTMNAACPEMTAGDTLVSVNGSNVCIHKFKGEGAKKQVGVLAMDCNFRVGKTIFPLKGNEKIKITKGSGNLAEGVLRASITYPSTAGDIVLEEGSVVAFYNGFLIGASITEPAVLKINGADVKCVQNEEGRFDVKFDNQGRLMTCTIADEMKWSNGLDLTFPAKSKLIFKNGKMTKVMSTTASSFDLNGKSIQVKSVLKSASYTFNSKNELSAVTADAGNSIEIEGQSVGVKEGTEIKMDVVDGKYGVSKFFAATEVKVNVYKKGKQKEVIVKPGKKIVISEGKVVKAG